MYCPRCGRQPVSNELRFCSFCGFKLGVIKASLADEEETHTTTALSTATTSTPPRHGNINIGVVLMFLASMVALVITGRGGGFGREGGALILTVLFGVILLSSSHIMKAIYRLLSWGELTSERLSASQREMGFGAALMFLTTGLSAILAFVTAGRMKAPALTFGVLIGFVLLLVVSPYILRALRHLIREESVSKNLMPNAPSKWSLTAAQEMPIASVESARVTTSELGVPVASVTEHTTGLLREK